MDDTSQELLISRIADGGASEGEWEQLTALAERDPSLWRQLAETLRDHVGLVRLMTRVAGTADAVEAPVGGRARPASSEAPGAWNPWARWSGWAVAATLMLAWVLTLGRAPVANRGPDPGPAVQQANVIPVRTAQEALQAYLAKGRAEQSVIREMPNKVLLGTRPNPAGTGYEIVFLRQVMEKTVVPSLYQLNGQDERGRPTLVRFEQPRRGAM